MFITAVPITAFACERVLFIGNQFSNLYTAVDTPARGRVGCVVELCVLLLQDLVQSCSRVCGGEGGGQVL